MKLSSLKSWLDAGLAFFYPEVCQICGSEQAGPAQGYVGGGCRKKVRQIEPPFCERCGLPAAGEVTHSFECSNCRQAQWSFLWARSAVQATGVALEIIHRYKYQRALWFEPILAEWLINLVEPIVGADPWGLIVPVPLHPAKRREREFNQAERLARLLGARLQIPVNAKAIKRVKFTRTQTMLSRSDRADNVRGAFLACPRTSLTGERIILVDDVLTTGATVNACAKELVRHGAAAVCVCTVARAIQ